MGCETLLNTKHFDGMVNDYLEIKNAGSFSLHLNDAFGIHILFPTKEKYMVNQESKVKSWGETWTVSCQ